MIYKSSLGRFIARNVLRGLCLVAMLTFAVISNATITWSSGTNTVAPDTTLQDTQIVITGGTNTVQGLAGPPAGATSGGILRLEAGGAGLQITGATVTLNSDSSSAGTLLIQGDVSTSASSTTAVIANGGSSTHFGAVDLGSATGLFTIAAGSVPSFGPDLSITARVFDGGLEKAGPGILALSGPNTYTGGTILDIGTFYINSATAIGSGFFTINGPNTKIDNTSGLPITLSNNNQFNLTGGDLTFIGTNDLNLGTGIVVMTNADRTITVADSSATLTVGGRVQDAGQDRGLTKAGPGTLVLGGNSLYAGPTNVNAGTMTLAGSLGNTTVAVGVNGTFINNGTVNNNVSVSGVMGGTGTINGMLTVNNGGIVDLTGGTFTVNGAIVNGGLFILSNGTQLAGVTSFTNSNVLDIMTAGTFTPPPNFTNNGAIIDSSVVKTKSVSRSGSTITLTIDSYTGHTYQLQKSSSPGFNSLNNVGPSQQGNTGTTLTFSDANATGVSSFYRILVNP